METLNSNLKRARALLSGNFCGAITVGAIILLLPFTLSAETLPDPDLFDGSKSADHSDVTENAAPAPEEDKLDKKNRENDDVSNESNGPTASTDDAGKKSISDGSDNVSRDNAASSDDFAGGDGYATSSDSVASDDRKETASGQPSNTGMVDLSAFTASGANKVDQERQFEAVPVGSASDKKITLPEGYVESTSIAHAGELAEEQISQRQREQEAKKSERTRNLGSEQGEAIPEGL